MTTSTAIYTAASVAFVASLLMDRGQPIVMLGCFWFATTRFIYLLDDDPSVTAWNELIFFTAATACKDFLFLMLFSFKQNTTVLILIVSLFVSCLFHQIILSQALTYTADNLTMYAIRPEFMKYLSVVLLTTMYYTILRGSDSSGGKLAKHWVSDIHYPKLRLFHLQTYKVPK
jgi:hypothetical protein